MSALCAIGLHEWKPSHGYYSDSAGRVVEYEQCVRRRCFREREAT